MLIASGNLTPSALSFRSMCLIAVFCFAAAAGLPSHAGAQQQGGGLHTVNPASGGAIVYGTLENQKSQAAGMIYMLSQVHGHYGDKPMLGKLVQARDGSSLAAFFTLTDKNFSHTQQGGMVLVDTVNGQMMAAVLTDEFKNFAKSEPGMVRTLMSAWHPAGSRGEVSSVGPAPGGGTMRTTQGGGQTVAYSASQKLYPATAGDRSVTIDLPPGWKITGMAGGQVTATGPNGEFIGAQLIWQNMPQARSSDLFRTYVNMANLMRQRAGKPQISFQLTSQQPIAKGQYTSGPGVIAYMLIDTHEGGGQCKGVAQISPAAGGGLFVTETWGPVKSYDAEQPLFIKIINTQRENTAVISAEGAADMDRIRQQGVRNNMQTEAINARSDASARSYESQRQAFNTRNNVGGTQQANGNTRQATGDSHMDEIDAGSEDMQNYILDRGVVQSTSTGNYGTFSDTFADDLVKSNPDKLVSTTNRTLLGAGQY